MSNKRGYDQGGYNKARMVGGKILKYRSAAPVAGSYRAAAAARSYGHHAGGLKGVDTLLSLTPIIATTNTNASAFTLNLIGPGPASYNRVGRKVKLVSLRIKGSFNFTYTPSATGVVVGNNVRMLVVWDKQVNGTLPIFSDIIGHTLQDNTEASTYMGLPRYDYMDRFQILADKVIAPMTPVGTTASTGSVEQLASIDLYLPLKGKMTTFSAQTATCSIADIATGALYVFFRAANNTTNNTVAVDANTVARLRYTDSI